MKRYYTGKLLMTATIALGLLMGACVGRTDYRKAEGEVWTTSYHIIYNSPHDLHDSIRAVFSRVEMSLSPFNEQSLITAINRGDSGVKPDAMLLRIFENSQMVCRQSGGKFDPTVAPLINLWGFGYTDDTDEPTQTQIDSALNLVGILRCTASADGIERPVEGMQFNFSAITKGYGVDMVADMLRRNGVADFMVEVGGEVVVHGKNARGDDWHIQIDAPIASAPMAHEGMAVVWLTDGAVATSGNYRNYRETASGRTWHTIDPVSGRPVQTPTLSATIVAPECMLADAYATACMAMQPADAIAMIQKIDNVEAMLVVPSEGDTLQIFATTGFPELH